MRRYQEERQWRNRCTGLVLTLRHESVVANGIRYPGSPRRKRCLLGCGGSDTSTAEAKVLSRPPGEYGRKAKTQRN